MGTTAQSIGSKKKFIGMTKRQLRNFTRKAMIARWKGKTLEEKRKHSEKMNLARWGNKDKLNA